MRPGLYEARSLIGGGAAVVELLDGPGERRRLAGALHVLDAVRSVAMPQWLVESVDEQLDVEGSMWSYKRLRAVGDMGED